MNLLSTIPVDEAEEENVGGRTRSGRRRDTDNYIPEEGSGSQQEKRAEEKRAATRLRVAKFRERRKADVVKQQEHLAAERVRDKERREKPKSRSETKGLRLKAKLRMPEQRKKIKEREEKDEMLQKRKGLLKIKSTQEEKP